MNTHVDRRQLGANSISQKQGSTSSTFQFIDNRTEFTVQHKLQKLANNSHKAMQLGSFQDMADNRSQERRDDLVQRMSDGPFTQLPPIQKKGNDTGLPDDLKTGVENLSGLSLDDVRVHRNSDKTAQLQANAYAQGTDIHLGAGQEKHLAHEAWHVVQQKQGRVKPTVQLKGGVNVNDDADLENEADVMGAKARQMRSTKKDDGGELVKARMNANHEVEGLNVQGGSNSLARKTQVFQRVLAGVANGPVAGQATLIGHSDRANALGGAHQSTNVDFTTGALAAPGHAANGEQVGLSMTANPLGPDHPAGSGPDRATMPNQIGRINATGDTGVRGHLLSGDLGGPGVSQNLFPITARANSLHYQNVEKHIKTWVNDNMHFVSYTVQVTNRNDALMSAIFECQWGPLNVAGAQTQFRQITRIRSEPGNSAVTLGPTNIVVPGGGAAIADPVNFADDHIEYQHGKAPVGWVGIEDTVIDQMRIDLYLKNYSPYISDFEFKLRTLGLSDMMGQAVEEYVLTLDSGIFRDERGKGAWNTTARHINTNYA